MSGTARRRRHDPPRRTAPPRGCRERGSALLVAIWMLALAGAAAASLAELARTAVARAGLGRDGVRAWFVAEAGLADTLAALPPGPDFSAALAAGPTTPPAGDAPWTWAVQFLDDADETPADPLRDANREVLVRIVARGPSPVRRRLEARLGRDDQPYFPGAASLRGSVRDLPQDFGLDGRDYRMETGCMTEGVEDARAGLALPGEATLPVLAWPEQIAGIGGTPSVARIPVPTLAEVADAPGGAHVPAGPVTTALGTIATPALTVVDGDAVIGGAMMGAGVLFTAGRLRVEGTLRFTGVVAAAGGLEVAATGRLDVCGGVWADGDPALDVDGTGAIRASAAALRLAARVAPLPARVRLLATRELS